MKLLALIILMTAVSVPYGWNAAKFINCDFESPFKCEAVHGIGIVVPPSSFITVWFSDDSKDSD